MGRKIPSNFSPLSQAFKLERIGNLENGKWFPILPRRNNLKKPFKV